MDDGFQVVKSYLQIEEGRVRRDMSPEYTSGKLIHRNSA